MLFAELYSLAGAGGLGSQQCHDVAVSALSLSSTSAAGVTSLATADRAGTVKVWQLARAEDSDQLRLRCVFVSEVAEAVRRRPVLSLCHPGTVHCNTILNADEVQIILVTKCHQLNFAIMLLNVQY